MTKKSAERATNPPTKLTYEEFKKVFAATLAAAGVATVRVTYSGGGDCGEIDGAQLLDAQGGDVHLPAKAQLPIPEQISELAGGTWTNKEVVTWLPPDEALTAWVNAILEDKPDWYNNEGGGGEFVIDLRSMEFTLHHYINITTTEYTDYTL